MSLTRWDGITRPVFLGFENYSTILNDPLFWHSLKVTLLFLAEYLPSVVLVSLFLAVLLTHKRLGKSVKWFRTVFFFPYVISLVLSGIIWRYVFEPSIGIMNYALSLFGLPQSRWLASTQHALPAVVIVSVWKYLGFYMLIFIAGLTEIPNVYYEAAKIDGANAWQSFVHITLPLLQRTFFFVIVIAYISAFQAFDQIYIMTKGGPANATRVLVYHLYEVAFRFFKLDIASALSIILFLFILAFTFFQIKLFGREATGFQKK